MTPRVGQVIRLEDARGCWRLHTVSKDDKRFADAIELAGQCWSGLRFHRRPFHAPATDATGRPVFRQIFRAAAPAIGGEGAPFSPLFLPAGWHAPAPARVA